MSKQNIRRAWPLYLVIAASGAASIATSTTTPPPLSANRSFQGAALRLDSTRATDGATFTIIVSPEYADPSVHVTGVLTYDLEGAPQDLRIALEEPGQIVLAEQVHRLEGAGQLEFMLTKHTQIQCALASTPVCVQDLALTFAADGALSGAIDVEWYLSTQLNSGLTDAPPDFVFEVDVPGGVPIEEIPWLGTIHEPEDQTGDGRWLAWAPFDLSFPDEQSADRQRVIMRGEGAFTSSELSMYVTVYSNYPAGLDEPRTVPFRLTVIPDELSTVPVIERVVTLTGDNWTEFQLSIPEPLDCPPGPVCERSFIVTLDAEGADAYDVGARLSLFGIIEGEGEAVPADAKVYLEPPESP